MLTSDPTNGSSPVPWFAIQTGASQGLYVGWEFRNRKDSRQNTRL